jgi:hypothetical protein
MKKLNIVFIMTFIFTFTSCSRQFKVSRIQPGSTYIADAIDLLDEPDVTDNSLAHTGTTLFIWKDISLQVDKEDRVQAVHRSPAAHEKSLQFWKHEYKELNTQFNKISTNELWQFNIPSRGINIIYDEKSDIVTKVILYEVK